MSNKSKPIHKIREIENKEHTTHEVVKRGDSQIAWKFISAVLLILFVASVYTKGFRLNELDNAQSSLNTLLAKDIGTEAKQSIQQALDSIKTAKLSLETASPTTKGYTGRKAKLDFYVMSKCPYGIQVENGVKPALDKLGDSVQFSINFIASEGSDGAFDSLHGETEVQGNIVQLCAMKYEPKKYMDMVICMNKDSGSIPGNWESCAKSSGMATDKISACYQGDEGKQLLSASIKKSEEVSARGSPTMFLNGSSYNGGRDTLSFMRALCSQLDNHPECASIPECASDADCTAEPDKEGKCTNPGQDNAKCEYTDAVKVQVTLLTDKLCTDCDTTNIQRVTKGYFKGAVFTTVDYGTPEGQALFNKYDVGYLPAYIFDNNIVNTGTWATNTRLQSAFVKHDDGTYHLAASQVGATWNPKAEVCNNGVDDRDQDGKIDCADDECSSQWTCMAKKDKPDVDLFIMSHCPYGTQTEKGILPVIDLLGNKVNFNIRFVYYAMHGETEVQEELAQYCMQTEQSAKYIPYLKCFLEAGDGAGCLDKAGIDKAKLDTCKKAADEKFQVTMNFNDKTKWLSGNYPLINFDKALNDKYKVGGSPTLIINGVEADANRDPQSLLTAICYGFKTKPAECSQQLSAEAFSPGFGFAATTSGAAASGGNCG